MDVMISKKDVDILSTIKTSFFDEKDEFGYKNGFNIAAAFTAYNNEYEWTLDPSYGNLIFNSYSWGERDDGSYFTETVQLEDHVCTRSELGLEDVEDARFLKARPASAAFVRDFNRKLLCVNEDDMYIHGDYDSYNARMLNIQLVKCKGGAEAGCKSNEEILKFFRNKFIVLYSNQIRFDSTKYGPDAIIKEAKTSWLAINTQVQSQIPYQVSSTQLFLQDEMINLDELTELSDGSVF